MGDVAEVRPHALQTPLKQTSSKQESLTRVTRAPWRHSNATTSEAKRRLEPAIRARIEVAGPRL